MELNELKDMWNKPTENVPDLQSNIRALMKRQSRNPIAVLKRRFRRGLIVLPLAFGFVTNVFSRHHVVTEDLLYWVYALFCIATMAYFMVSYRLVGKITSDQSNVRDHLQHCVAQLSRLLRWRRLGTCIMMIFLLLLLETLLHYQAEPALVNWYNRPVLLRVSIYAVAVAIFFTAIHFSFKYRYERYLNQIQGVLNQMN